MAAQSPYIGCLDYLGKLVLFFAIFKTFSVRCWRKGVLLLKSIIHRVDLARLNNLELFSQSPSMTVETYRAMGRNAARYAAKKITTPVPVTVDNWARLRLIVKTALLHRKETEEIRQLPPEALRFDWEPEV